MERILYEAFPEKAYGYHLSIYAYNCHLLVCYNYENHATM